MEGFDVIEDLKWVILVMILIWVVWLLTGGPSRYEATHGIFLKPPAPLDTGQTYGELPKVSIKIPDTLNVSLGNGRTALSAKMDVRATNPEEEYMDIVGSSDSPVNITGWRLENSKGESAVVPGGARLIVSGQVNQTDNIYLARGEHAILITGESPVGVSFRTNSCSGYLSQFQNFTPELSSACPSPLQAASLKQEPFDSVCLDYIKKMPACETPISALPKNLSASCHEFVLTHASHNACVNDYKNNTDFYSNEWRVYLGKGKEMWANHDTIRFYDQNNSLIGTYAY